MRELFVEELESVVGGQPVPDLNDYAQTTMACCEEGPLSGCCWWWDVVEHISITFPP